MPAPLKKTELARALRGNGTPEERRLWSALRNRRLQGFKFKRQFPIGPYIADFVCEEARLVIELDGATHPYKNRYETARDAYLWHAGFEVLHIANYSVETAFASVLQIISFHLAEQRTDAAQSLPQRSTSPRGEVAEERSG